MPDYTLDPKHTLVVGMTGSGKTTWVIRYLLNVRAVACRFVFDDLNRMWPRIVPELRRTGSPCPVLTAAQLEASLQTRWSVYNHERQFPLVNFAAERGVPTPAHKAFRDWCGKLFILAQRGPGPKLVCVPEVWRFCTPDSLPPEFALLAQAGRELGIELVLDTQRPEMLNPSLTGAITELVCFKLASREALKAVADLGADREAVEALPLGSFIAYDRLTGAQRPGKLF